MVAMMFRTLTALVAFMALPITGMAMEFLGDDELAGISGQDGISLSAQNLDYQVDFAWEDTTGLGPASAAPEHGMVLARTRFLANGPIDIDIDAGSSASGVDGGVLQIAVSLPELVFEQFRVYVGGVGVGASTSGAGLERFNDFRDRVDSNTPPIDTILEIDDITVSEMNVVLQLGEDASNLAVIEAATGVTITMNNILLHDRSTSGGGAIIMDQLTIADYDLDGTTVGLLSNGLRIVTPSGGGHQVAVSGLGFADSNGVRQNALGDIYMDTARNSASVITITGR